VFGWKETKMRYVVLFVMTVNVLEGYRIVYTHVHDKTNCIFSCVTSCLHEDELLCLMVPYCSIHHSKLFLTALTPLYISEDIIAEKVSHSVGIRESNMVYEVLME
jgi:hypothetical protein